jgi:hypothetical protein
VISRQSCGLVHSCFSDAYARHLRTETFPQLYKIPGFIDASALTQITREGVEFLIVANRVTRSRGLPDPMLR